MMLHFYLDVSPEGEKQSRPFVSILPLFDCQGDREGRPYNTKLPALHVKVYCTGDPRGRPDRPGTNSQTLSHGESSQYVISMRCVTNAFVITLTLKQSIC